MLDGLDIVDGALRYKDLICVSAVTENDSDLSNVNSLMAVYDQGEWQAVGVYDGLIVSINVSKKNIEQFMGLTSGGKVIYAGSGDFHEEFIERNSNLPLRSVKNINGSDYAVGMGYEVYKREKRDCWIRVNEGLPATYETLRGFEDISGYSSKEIYAVGWNGEIWFFNGIKWRILDSPVNTILSSVYCSPDGYVYCIGRRGTIVKGRYDKWFCYGNNEVTDDFWGIEYFLENIYILSEKAIYRIEKDSFDLIKVVSDNDNKYRRISSNSGFLCLIEASKIGVYDGTKWDYIK